MDFNTLMTTDSDDKFALAINDINTRGKALQLDIQIYLNAVCNRWLQTGDVRPAIKRINMLVDKKALFKGARRNAIVTWVEVNMGFEYITEGDHKDQFHANNAKAKRLDMAALSKAENHWYNATPEPDPQPVSLNVLLAALVKKAEARAAKNKAGDDIPADKLAALKALIEPDTDSALEKAAEEPSF